MAQQKCTADVLSWGGVEEHHRGDRAVSRTDWRGGAGARNADEPTGWTHWVQQRTSHVSEYHKHRIYYANHINRRVACV
jgi:hypothetical protein